MAGSLNHIVNPDGSFTMNLIENMGDAHEALEECHQIIAWLLESHSVGDAKRLLAVACDDVGVPRSAVPKVSLRTASRRRENAEPERFTNGTCWDCRHWSRIQGNEGQCRRHPPMVSSTTGMPLYWPKTHGNEWCGEFKHDPYKYRRSETDD